MPKKRCTQTQVKKIICKQTVFTKAHVVISFIQATKREKERSVWEGRKKRRKKQSQWQKV